MENTGHQWTRFQKGRLKVKACARCGEMSLPSNSESYCDNRSILSSPIVRAGYVLADELPDAKKAQRQVA